MSKLPIPSGPGGLARQFKKGGDAIDRRSTDTPADIVKPPRRVKADKPSGGAKSLPPDIKRELKKLTKAEKVKAWREANPELYEKQKREYAAKRKAKK